MTAPRLPTVLLFDIDGTLLASDKAGLRALNVAFLELHGRDDACAGFSLHGMTDRAIVRRGLLAVGATADEGAINRVLEAYLQALGPEVASASPSRYVAHPGIVEAVDAARARGCAVGLGTGNVRRGAELKLGRLGLFERFSFGGFGDDHEDRAELVRIGAERGAARLGIPRAGCRVVIIGDTPHDFAAAEAIGGQALLVATGAYDVQALRALGASVVVENLAVPGALPWLLGD